MVELAANIWADGPLTDPYEPEKWKIRQWGTWIEGIITAFTSNGGLIYSSKAAMDADLAHAANSMAWVIGDPVSANNGIYGKVGASGSGSWARRADLPFSFIIASDAGVGTANAIQATTSIPVSASALIWMNVFEANTASPVTVSFNGGPALTIKTNSGNDIAAGGLVAGMTVLGIVSGATFRLVSDQSSTAIAAAAEAAADRAESAAGVVINLQSLGGDPTAAEDASAILVSGCGVYKHVVVPNGEFLIDENITIPADATVEFLQGGRLKVGTGVAITWNGGITAGPYQQIFSGSLVQSGYTTNSLTPYVLALQGNPKIKWASPWWFGAKGDNVTDDYNALVCAMSFGKVCYIPGLDVASGQRYLCTTSLPVRQTGSVIRGDGYSSWMRLVSYVPSGVGSLIGIAGLLPAVSGGEPAAYVDNVLIEGVHFDTNNGTNDNGIGGSFARNIEVRNCFFSNVGRKAVTWQYHVHGWKVHDNTIFSASMETGGTQNAITSEGENSSFTYSNGVAGYDWNGDDNEGHVVYSNRILQSGVGGITLSNCKRTIVRDITMATLGASGRPVVTSRVTKDVTFESVKANKSTLGFLRAASSTSISQRFINCWIEDCSGDAMFYSEGPGSSFEGSGGTQTDNRQGWSIRGANCKIINSTINLSAITSATVATGLFSTATDFEMYGCKIGGAAALRGFGGSTATGVRIHHNTFAGGITDGVKVGGAGASVTDNVIGGDGEGRIRVDIGTANCRTVGNRLTGSSPQVTWSSTTDLYTSGEKHGNLGDVTTYQCQRYGTCIAAYGAGTPLSVVTAAVGSTWGRTDGGAGSTFYVKESGSDASGWAAK